MYIGPKLQLAFLQMLGKEKNCIMVLCLENISELKHLRISMREERKYL